MNWLFLTLLSVLFASVASILQRVLMKDDRSNPYLYAIVFHFLLGFLSLGLGLFYGVQFSLFSGDFLLLLLASGLWGATSIFLFKALQVVEASEATIVSSLKVLVTIVASVLFLHEVVSGQKILGALIIIVATLLVVNIKNGFKLNRGLVYVFAMALFAGLAIVVDSANVQEYDVITYNTFQNFLTGFIIFAFYPKGIQQWRHISQPSFLIKMLPLVVFSTVQGLLYLLALTQEGHTAEIGTIRQASTIVTVILAVIFLKERDNVWRKFLAVILVTLGVFLLQ